MRGTNAVRFRAATTTGDGSGKIGSLKPHA
jgi:hypothetical protein